MGGILCSVESPTPEQTSLLRAALAGEGPKAQALTISIDKHQKAFDHYFTQGNGEQVITDFLKENVLGFDNIPTAARAALLQLVQSDDVRMFLGIQSAFWNSLSSSNSDNAWAWALDAWANDAVKKNLLAFSKSAAKTLTPSSKNVHGEQGMSDHTELPMQPAQRDLPQELTRQLQQDKDAAVSKALNAVAAAAVEDARDVFLELYRPAVAGELDEQQQSDSHSSADRSVTDTVSLNVLHDLQKVLLSGATSEVAPESNTFWPSCLFCCALPGSAAALQEANKLLALPGENNKHDARQEGPGSWTADGSCDATQGRRKTFSSPFDEPIADLVLVLEVRKDGNAGKVYCFENNEQISSLFQKSRSSTDSEQVKYKELQTPSTGGSIQLKDNSFLVLVARRVFLLNGPGGQANGNNAAYSIEKRFREIGDVVMDNRFKALFGTKPSDDIMAKIVTDLVTDKAGSGGRLFNWYRQWKIAHQPALQKKAEEDVDYAHHFQTYIRQYPGPVEQSSGGSDFFGTGFQSISQLLGSGGNEKQSQYFAFVGRVLGSSLAFAIQSSGGIGKRLEDMIPTVLPAVQGDPDHVPNDSSSLSTRPEDQEDEEMKFWAALAGAGQQARKATQQFLVKPHQVISELIHDESGAAALFETTIGAWLTEQKDTTAGNPRPVLFFAFQVEGLAKEIVGKIKIGLVQWTKLDFGTEREQAKKRLQDLIRVCLDEVQTQAITARNTKAFFDAQPKLFKELDRHLNYQNNYQNILGRRRSMQRPLDLVTEKAIADVVDQVTRHAAPPEQLQTRLTGNEESTAVLGLAEFVKYVEDRVIVARTRAAAGEQQLQGPGATTGTTAADAIATGFRSISPLFEFGEYSMNLEDGRREVGERNIFVEFVRRVFAGALSKTAEIGKTVDEYQQTQLQTANTKTETQDEPTPETTHTIQTKSFAEINTNQNRVGGAAHIGLKHQIASEQPAQNHDQQLPQSPPSSPRRAIAEISFSITATTNEELLADTDAEAAGPNSGQGQQQQEFQVELQKMNARDAANIASSFTETSALASSTGSTSTTYSSQQTEQEDHDHLSDEARKEKDQSAVESANNVNKDTENEKVGKGTTTMAGSGSSTSTSKTNAKVDAYDLRAELEELMRFAQKHEWTLHFGILTPASCCVFVLAAYYFGVVRRVAAICCCQNNAWCCHNAETRANRKARRQRLMANECIVATRMKNDDSKKDRQRGKEPLGQGLAGREEEEKEQMREAILNEKDRTGVEYGAICMGMLEVSPTISEDSQESQLPNGDALQRLDKDPKETSDSSDGESDFHTQKEKKVCSSSSPRGAVLVFGAKTGQKGKMINMKMNGDAGGESMNQQHSSGQVYRSGTFSHGEKSKSNLGGRDTTGTVTTINFSSRQAAGLTAGGGAHFEEAEAQAWFTSQLQSQALPHLRATSSVDGQVSYENVPDMATTRPSRTGREEDEEKGMQ
ncbi:unnamed protein product [Amoebophrya sp. A120]|nr:unnamed protein product [Amoebophrya sp. A120]|eukprot:GSA120T00013334001.1